MEAALKEQKKVLDVNWEWILVKVTSVTALPNEGFLQSNKPDAFLSLKALASEEPDINFHGNAKLSEYEFPVKWNESDPRWYRIGIVAYIQGKASELEFALKDKERFTKDRSVINQKVTFPKYLDKWVDVTVEQNGVKLNVSLLRSNTPLFTERDHQTMRLTEELFPLENGEKASLAYRTESKNDKAVLYFPGRQDSFAHPHVLELLLANGYDFYTLDCRKCGRTRRFLQDPRYGHDSSNFDEYKEEIDLALNFIKSKKNYKSPPLAMCHSTGGPTVLNYKMMVGDNFEPFSGYIFNAPFLDWGHVGGDLEEFILEHPDLLRLLPGSTGIASEGKGLAPNWTRTWLLYRFNVNWKPLIQTHVTADWAKAVTKVQNKLVARRTPITAMPVQVLSSKGDSTLVHSETVERAGKIVSEPDVVGFEFNTHDVTQSFTKELNDDALSAVKTFLSTKVQ